MCAWCRRRTEEALNLELEVQVIVSQLLCDSLGLSLGRSEPPTALSSPKLLEATVYQEPNEGARAGEMARLPQRKGARVQIAQNSHQCWLGVVGCL